MIGASSTTRELVEAFLALPVVMIGLGAIFLLNNLGVLRFSQIFRFWPIALIAAGVIIVALSRRR